MLFGARRSSLETGPLKPFLLKLQEGYLLGLEGSPHASSPCSGCVQLWMAERGVFCEQTDVALLGVRREKINELIEKANPHHLYEISRDGVATLVEAVIFPHPSCACDKSLYVPPTELSASASFAFSPISRIEVMRYHTPEGELWLGQATGKAVLNDERVTAMGVGRTREEARLRALESWMRQTALSDSKVHKSSQAEIFQTGAKDESSDAPAKVEDFQAVGVGFTPETAGLDALYQITKERVLRSFSGSGKSPMLVVGANTWLTRAMPLFLLQQYDLHLLFYPNAMPAWVVGVGAFSRLKSDEKPIFSFGAHSSPREALLQALYRTLAVAPAAGTESSEKNERRGFQLNLWWTHWLYRCPKISLREILQLEAYPANIDVWRDYYKDGQPPVTVQSLNHSCLPGNLLSVLQMKLRDTATSPTQLRLNGIGTWSDFRGAFKN